MFLVVLIYALTFQLLFLANIALADTMDEVVFFPISYSLIVLVLGVLFYFYIKHLPGGRRYRGVKEVIWGLFFTATAVSSLFWFSVNGAVYSKELLSNQILLASIFLGSTVLAVQITIKFKREGSGKN